MSNVTPEASAENKALVAAVAGILGVPAQPRYYNGRMVKIEIDEEHFAKLAASLGVERNR